MPATRAEADFIRGAAVLAAAKTLADSGFRPELIIAHPGWGECLFLKELWPDSRVLVFGELIYRTRAGDVGFDPEFGDVDLAEKIRVHAKNASQLLAYAFADRIICPTAFQASSFPPSLQHLIRVVHEGIDVDAAARRTEVRITMPSGKTLTSAKPVITYVSRALEPQRGFHIFMRALPKVLDACPGAEVVIVGDPDREGYGRPNPTGKSWKSILLDELGDRLDQSRVHFTGLIKHTEFIDVLSISWAHVYFTYPVVLSWSLLEAMACECLVIASDTAPVRDAISDGENGLLQPFFDVEALSDHLTTVITDPQRFDAFRKRARKRVVCDFNVRRGTELWKSEIDELVGRAPAGA